MDVGGSSYLLDRCQDGRCSMWRIGTRGTNTQSSVRRVSAILFVLSVCPTSRCTQTQTQTQTQRSTVHAEKVKKNWRAGTSLLSRT